MSTDQASTDTITIRGADRDIVFEVEAPKRRPFDKFGRHAHAIRDGKKIQSDWLNHTKADHLRFVQRVKAIYGGRGTIAENVTRLDRAWNDATARAKQKVKQRSAELAAKRASAPATIPIAPPPQQTEITVNGFTYGGLEQSAVTALEDHAAAIQQITETVRRSGAEAVLAIGKALSEAHDLLAGNGKDGLFRPWIKERCGFGKSAAYRAMAAYAAFNKCPSVGRFDPTALYLLSNDLCPEDATQEAIDRATKGEQITAKTAREIKARHKGDGDRPEQLLCLEACKLIRAAVVRIGDRVHPDHAPAVVEFLRTLADQIEDGRQEIAGVCLTTRDGGAE